MLFYNRIFRYGIYYKHTLFTFILIITLFANLFSREVVNNVSFDITERNEMVIYYTLTPEDSDEYYKVTALISADGGKTWFSPKSIRGDIGRQKGAGTREIFWNIFRDREELEGDIQVKVTAKLQRTFFQTFVIPSKNARNKSRINYNISYPIIDFPNPTYQKNIQNGILEPGFPLGGGVQVIEIPLKFEIDAFIIPYNVNDRFSIYDDMDWSNDQYIYQPEASIEYSSISISLSYAIAPNIAFFTPFLGMGVQSSGIIIHGYCGGNGECGYGGRGQDRESSSNKTITSDLFASADLLFYKGIVVIGLSYKHSLIRELRKWSQVQINFGLSLIDYY